MSKRFKDFLNETITTNTLIDDIETAMKDEIEGKDAPLIQDYLTVLIHDIAKELNKKTPNDYFKSLIKKKVILK